MANSRSAARLPNWTFMLMLPCSSLCLTKQRQIWWFLRTRAMFLTGPQVNAGEFRWIQHLPCGTGASHTPARASDRAMPCQPRAASSWGSTSKPLCQQPCLAAPRREDEGKRGFPSCELARTFYRLAREVATRGSEALRVNHHAGSQQNQHF